METLEQLAGTLDTLGDLRSIVRTMKALSAASIRQYERAVESLRQYARTVELGLYVVLRELPDPPARYRRPHGPMGLVVFGSDHGLCGRFNEDITEFVRERLQARVEGEPARILVAGDRLTPLLEGAGLHVDQTLQLPGSASRITALVDRIILTLDAWQEHEGVVAVHVFSTRRTAGVRPHPVAQRLLPVDLRRFAHLAEQRWPSPVLPTFSMDRDQLFAALARQHLFISLFRACAESQASEHASRLAAMQRASRNLDERQDELLGRYRRRRQEVVTAELLDVVAGYEAQREPQD